MLFSVDGYRLISAGRDGSVLTSDITAGTNWSYPTLREVEQRTGLRRQGNDIQLIPKRVEWHFDTSHSESEK